MLDIKNNRQRSQGTGGPLTISSVLSAGVLKWLRSCGAEEVQLRNLTWQTVLQQNKKVILKCYQSSRNALDSLCRGGSMQHCDKSCKPLPCAEIVEPWIAGRQQGSVMACGSAYIVA